MATFPYSVSTLHPRTYLMQVHSPSLNNRLFRLTEFLDVSEKWGKIHLSTLIFPSKTWFWCYVTPLTTVMTSSI